MSATTPKTFDSGFKLGAHFECANDNDTVKNEPMFFNADLGFAYLHGGPITRAFIDALPKDWREGDVVFDSRQHMLMPGSYPAIPGYHHDDVYRRVNPLAPEFDKAGNKMAAQPDYDNLEYEAEHILGLVNARVAPTAFAVGKCTMPAVALDENIYGVWNDEVERLIEAGDLKVAEAPDRQLVHFNWEDFHTAQPAKEFGFRWFARVSRNTTRTQNITNEIRANAMVYMPFPKAGW